MPERMGRRIRWMGDVLRSGAEKEIREYERRFTSAAGLYDTVLSNLIIQSFDPQKAANTARIIFSSPRVKFAAIDGTDYSRVLFDLVVFFGGSYAATGTVDFEPTGPEIEYDPSHLEDAKGICSCVPIYINQVADIDQAISGDQEEIAYSRLLTDEEIATNSEIANRIMTFSEFYLAHKLASDVEAGIRIILMDRTLSGEVSSLMYDTSNRTQWSRACSILGHPIGGVPIDENELYYSRHHVRNRTLGTLPPRGDYLVYSILHHLEEGNKGDLEEICKALGLTTARQKKRASSRLARLKRDGMIGDILGNYRMASRYEDYWDRVKSLVLEIGDRLFSQEGEELGRMTLESGGKRRYLTTMDLAFLTLFVINMLIEECWNRDILLIGLTKDTAARDFKRHVLPLLSNVGAFEKPIDARTFEHIPNTDRMFLQATSMMNHEKLDVPWALVEYDCAMRTMVHDPNSGMDRVRGAIKNKIIPERLMIKSYVQLAKAKKDPRFRSNVILTDRLAHPGFDAKEPRVMEFMNEYGGALEPVSLVLERGASSPSELQNLIVVMLSAMTSSDIPELFGHNKPLFIADKVAKWNNACFRRMVETTATWIKTNPDVRDFVFYMSSFRERRSTIEYARRSR